MDVFQEVRERVSARQAAELYGLEFDRVGRRAACPWHADRHPSLSFKDDFCKCFACGAGGSSIDIAMQLFNLDAKGAAAKLNDDFHLCLNLSAPVSASIVRKAQDDKHITKALDVWINSAYDTLARRRRLLREWEGTYRPTDPDAPFHQKFIEALNKIDKTEFLLDQLEAATTPLLKITLYKDYREEVTRYERELPSNRRPDPVGA